MRESGESRRRRKKRPNIKVSLVWHEMYVLEDEMTKHNPLFPDLHSYDDRTPERSPTPRRGEGERLHKDNEEEDEEDSRLEAALRGDHKKELEGKV